MLFFPEQLAHKKEMAQRAKCLCLESMGMHPLFNVSNMNMRDKKKLIEKVRVMLDEETEEWITNEFNELCCEKLFGKEGDYTTYNICQGTQFCEQPEIEEWKIDPLEVAVEYTKQFPDNTEVSL